tara:strand:- start:724 stop:1434 length:711 start_codon:yes stop_codon:yes gene_type:complete
MEIAKNIIRSVRNIRLKVDIPNKQPLSKLTIITNDSNKLKQIKKMEEIILNELNVKILDFDENFEKWVKYECKPNFSSLGPKLGQNINEFIKYLSNLGQEEIKELIANKKIKFKKENIDISDIDIRLIKNEERNNQDIVQDFSVYLDTYVDDELLKERISREIVSIVQKQRKEMGFDITDRISLNIKSDNEIILKSVEEFKDYIANETLTIDFKIVNEKASNKILDYFVDTIIKIS